MHNPKHFHMRQPVRADELIPGVVYFDKPAPNEDETALEFIGRDNVLISFKYVSGEDKYASHNGLIEFHMLIIFYK
jgi:hypothetical protein